MASEQFLVDGVDPNLPREITLVPATGSMLEFNTNKSLVITDNGTVSNNAWRAGDARNIFVMLQSETVETEFAVQSLTGNSVTLYHTGEIDLDSDGEPDTIEIIVGLTR